MNGELALPRGARVQDLVIDGVIGVGGFGIVYRVRDTALDRSAALKEYLPAALAVRDAGGQIVPRSPAHEEHFRLGMRSFVNEARLLASLDHAALLKVWRFWPANGTAYMLMPFYEGITLRQWLAALDAPPREDWLRHLARELIDAVGILHGRDILHRDIAPDNVLLLHGDGRVAPVHQLPRPLLLDFGSARLVVAEATQNLTAFLKSGYSPFEQYGGTLPQGPWTDVYSLCAVLYTAVAGKPPLSAVARSVKDTLVPATEAGRGRYTHTLLAAIDAGLALRPEHRPQTMAELRARLDEGFAPTMMVLRPKAAPSVPPPPAPSATPAARAAEEPMATRPRRRTADPAANPWVRVGAAALALAALLAAAAWWLR